jgi:periplasmic protein TonB
MTRPSLFRALWISVIAHLVVTVLCIRVIHEETIRGTAGEDPASHIEIFPAQLRATPSPEIVTPPLALPAGATESASESPSKSPSRARASKSPRTHTSAAGSTVHAPSHAPPGPTARGRPSHRLRAIMRRLRRAKRYPPEARRHGIEGATLVEFTIDPDGSIKTLRLVTSSGSPLLDTAALETVHAAAPLPRHSSALRIPITFRLR